MKQPGKEKQIAKKIFLLSLKKHKSLKCWNIQISGKACVGGGEAHTVEVLLRYQAL